MAHFTLCQMPWHWLPSDDDRIQEWLCRKLHREWFCVRKDLKDFLIATKKQRRSVAKFLLPTFYIAIIRCLGVLEARVISAAYPYVASRVSMGPYVAEKKKKARSQK